PADVAPSSTQSSHTIHAADDRVARHGHPQRFARHDAARREPHHAPTKPHGACVGVARADCAERAEIRRSARDDRVQRLFARQGPEAQRFACHPRRPIGSEAAPMIAQLILTALLLGIVLYAWTEHKRSPAIGLLAMLAALTGLYFVWIPKH